MKKLLSVFLALVMVFALCGGVLADETTVTEEPATEAPAEDTATETPAEEPAEEPTEEPAEEPTEEPAEEPAAGDIVVLYTNDVHCAITGELGYSNVAAYEDAMLAEGNYVTLVDAGDAIQGAAYGSMSKGEDIIGIMNAMGYDVAVIGNHEFDYGRDRLFELAGKLECGYVSANFISLADNEPVFDAYKLITYGDTTVAYVGFSTPDTYTKSTPVYFQDDNGNYIYSFGEDDFVGHVQAAIDAAIAEGADYVIGVGHLGIDPESAPYRSTDVIPQLSGLDAFIDGHSHSVIASQTVKGADGEDVILTSTGTKFANFGKLTIDAETGAITTELISDYTETAADMDEYLNALFAKYADTFSTVVAKSDITLTGYAEDGTRLVRTEETNIGDLCADAYRVVGEADIGLVNGGGIRADIAAGDITYQNIIDVHPFGNMLCVVETTGQQILNALEMAVMALPTESGGFLHVSGLSFSVDTSVESPVVLDAMGNFVEVDGARRVSNVEVAGEAIDPEGTYTVASHNYMLKQGGDGFTMFMGDKLLVDESMADNEVLITYITEDLGGVVPETYAEPQGRIVIDGTSEPVEEGLPFTDVAEGAWYYDYVVTAYENSLMLGVSDTAFAPNTELTRGMMVTMLYRLAGSPEVTGSASDVFADAEDDSWYSDAVVWADQNGLFEALALETLDADAVITREELAEMLYAYEVATGAEAVEDAELTWADAAEVSADAVSAVAYCTDAGLMNGVSDTEFDPDGSATRAMCATVLVRLFEAGELEAAA